MTNNIEIIQQTTHYFFLVGHFHPKYKTLCWMVVQHLDKTTLKDHDTFKSSEWGPEAAAAMCKEVRDLPIPNGPPGSTLGTLIDLTPKELISKATLEEKVFQTWYSGRSLLIGDGNKISEMNLCKKKRDQLLTLLLLCPSIIWK